MGYPRQLLTVGSTAFVCLSLQLVESCGSNNEMERQGNKNYKMPSEIQVLGRHTQILDTASGVISKRRDSEAGLAIRAFFSF